MKIFNVLEVTPNLNPRILMIFYVALLYLFKIQINNFLDVFLIMNTNALEVVMAIRILFIVIIIRFIFVVTVIKVKFIVIVMFILIAIIVIFIAIAI